MSDKLEAAADIVAAVSLISNLVGDFSKIVKLFESEDLTEEEVEKILAEKRSNIESRIEN